MKVFGLVLAVFVLMALFDVSHSLTTTIKPKTSTGKPIVQKPATLKPTTVKPKPVNSIVTSTIPPKTIITPKPVNAIVTSTAPPAGFKCPGYRQNCYSFIVEPIYATNGGICKLFTNRCEFSNTNCDLLAQNQKVWDQVSAEACKPLCPKCEQYDNDIVCGALFNKQSIPFFSECLMDSFSCFSGQPYTKVDLSECNLSSQKDEYIN